jgi:hypothetical protein
VILGAEPVEQGVEESVGISEVVDSSGDFLDELMSAVGVASVESVETLLFNFSTGEVRFLSQRGCWLAHR